MQKGNNKNILWILSVLWCVFLGVGAIIMFAYAGYTNQKFNGCASGQFLTDLVNLGASNWTKVYELRTAGALDIFGSLMLIFWGISWIAYMVLHGLNYREAGKNLAVYIVGFIVPPVSEMVNWDKIIANVKASQAANKQNTSSENKPTEDSQSNN